MYHVLFTKKRCFRFCFAIWLWLLLCLLDDLFKFKPFGSRFVGDYFCFQFSENALLFEYRVNWGYSVFLHTLNTHFIIIINSHENIHYGRLFNSQFWQWKQTLCHIFFGFNSINQRWSKSTLFFSFHIRHINKWIDRCVYVICMYKWTRRVKMLSIQ